jgi:hypothetical protein
MDEDWDGEEEEDGPLESTPLLPMFSASHLGMKAPCGIPKQMLTKFND